MWCMYCKYKSYTWGWFNYHPNDPSSLSPTHCCCLAQTLCNTFMPPARGHSHNRWQYLDGLKIAADPVIITFTREARFTIDARSKSEVKGTSGLITDFSTKIPSLGTGPSRLNHKKKKITHNESRLGEENRTACLLLTASEGTLSHRMLCTVVSLYFHRSHGENISLISDYLSNNNPKQRLDTGY